MQGTALAEMWNCGEDIPKQGWMGQETLPKDETVQCAKATSCVDTHTHIQTPNFYITFEHGTTPESH